MNFYRSKFYSFLRENRDNHSFHLLSENIGVLVIFDTQTFSPKCILIESWLGDLPLETQLSAEELDSLEVATFLYSRTGIPFYFFRYNDYEINSESRIYFSDQSKQLNITTISNFFSEVIQVPNLYFTITNASKRIKPINSLVSTPFHKWQRECLLYNGFPVDIDIFYFGQNPAILEIKRSVKTGWKPYKDDAMNYLALCNFCDLVGIDFFLLFIQQYENNGQRIDDYHNIQVFNVLRKIGDHSNADSLFFFLSRQIQLEDLLNNPVGLDFSLSNDTWKEPDAY